MIIDVTDLIKGWKGEVIGNEVDIHSSGIFRNYYERRWNMANMLEVENDLA